MRLLLLFLLINPFILSAQCISNALITSHRPENPFAHPDGPFCAGETVEICFDFDFTSDMIGTGNDCAWVQGIIPRFGSGWDINAIPLSNQNSAYFFWHPSGSVDYDRPMSSLKSYTDMNMDLKICHSNETDCTMGSYLTQGSLLPGGWWAVSNGGPGCINDGDPDNMWGMPQACGSTVNYGLCINVKTKGMTSYCEAYEFEDYRVSFYVFSDGETGCNNGYTCSSSSFAFRKFNASCNCNAARINAYSNCQGNLNLNNYYLRAGDYKAANDIYTQKIDVAFGEYVKLEAGNSILMDAGTTILPGAAFEAKIGTCPY